MENIINCLEIRDNILKDINVSQGRNIFIQVGNRADSNIYIRNKKRLCNKYGISHKHVEYEEYITEQELIDRIEHFNNCHDVTGIMVQLPLPKHINEEAIINAIDPKKDIDGFTHINKGKLMVGDETAIIPCTPLGIIKILEGIDFDCKGKNVVIVGRSNIVGKPMVQLLINEGATVTCCNSNTPQEKIKELIFNSDLFISAIDKPCYYDVEYFGKDNLTKLNNTIAIDVGIIKVNDKIEGNISKEIYENFKAITSVPGGVGLMTVAGVLMNIVKCSKMNIK